MTSLFWVIGGLIGLAILFQFAAEIGLIVVVGGIIWAAVHFGCFHQIFSGFFQ